MKEWIQVWLPINLIFLSGMMFALSTISWADDQPLTSIFALALAIPLYMVGFAMQWLNRR